MDDATGVTSLDFDLKYDPTLLTINSVLLSQDAIDEGWSITINHNPLTGILEVTAFGSALSGSDLAVILLDASVPEDAPYGESQALKLSNIVLGSGGGPLSALADRAIHKNTYLGDADGSGNYADPNDPALIMRVAVELDSGFSQHRWTDPYIIANVSNSGIDGLPSGLDASWVAEKGAALPRPEIPDLPIIGPLVAAGVGLDPELSIESQLLGGVGHSITVPVTIDTTDASPEKIVLGASYTVAYDATKLEFEGVEKGAFWNTGWSLVVNPVNPEDATGLVTVKIFSTGTPSSYGIGEIGLLHFTVLATAAPGDAIPLDIESSITYDALFDLTWEDVDGIVGITYTADFDLDGDVDGDDLPLWQTGYGTTTNATIEDGDADGDGDVDGRDYMAYMRQFGNDLSPLVDAVVSIDEEIPALVEASSELAPPALSELVATVVVAGSDQGNPFQAQEAWVTSVSTDATSEQGGPVLSDTASLDAAFAEESTASTMDATSNDSEIDFGIEDTVLESEADDTELEFGFAEECDAVFEAWS